MRRRTFIGRTAALLLGIPATEALAGGSDIPVWNELIDYARWSPSPHNIQPWRVMIMSATEADVYYDTARLLPATDPTSKFTVVGMSMFIKCLKVAAAPLGFRIETEHCDETKLDFSSNNLKFFAKLRLIPTSEAPLYDRELILKRKTSRLRYNNKPVEAHVVDNLKAIAQKHGYALNDSTDEDLVNFTLDLNLQTLFHDLDNTAARKELSGWIRTTPEEAEQKKDGLWSKCMGFRGKLMHNFFFHHERFRAKWKRKILSKVYLKSMKGTAHISWLTGKFETRQDWLAAGEMLQELWLEMTKHDVFLHPFGSVVTNTDAHQKFIKRIEHDNREELWLLMRMGYSKDPPRSFRLTTNDILINFV